MVAAPRPVFQQLSGRYLSQLAACWGLPGTSACASSGLAALVPDSGSAAGVRRVRRMRSTARVMSVVATDKTIVPATIATTAHSGRWAGAAVDGGGGTGAPEGCGESRPGAAAARPISGARKTASALSDVRVRRVRGMPRSAGRGCDGAGRWFIWVTHSAAWAAVSGGVFCAPAVQRGGSGIVLGPAWNHGLERRWTCSRHGGGMGESCWPGRLTRHDRAGG